MSTQRWEVLTLIGNHWENVWSLDGDPETFDSYDDADAALAEHLRDCQWAVDAGHLDDTPTRDAFRIAPCVDTFLTA
jgi:hypothetical protein